LTAFDADLPTGTQAGIFVRNDTAVTTHVATIDNLSIVAPSMVRLDLNSWAGGLMVQPDGIQLDPPDLNRAGGGSLLVDGFYPTGATFGNRTIGLPLQVLPTATADQIATTLQSLHRELNRPTNFLRIQLAGMTSAVWFRTLRAPDYTFKMLRLQLVDNTQALLEIPAEPFGYGRREMLPAVTVTNDPAAGSNGQFFDVTGVKGDVQTPLSMSVSTGVLSGGANPDTNRFISHLATRRRGDPTALTWFVQCESMTMGTDTSANANTADSGGSRALCTFATVATMTNRVSTTFPSAPNDEIRGTYRVYLRCRASASGHGPMSVQLTWGSIDGTAASVYANNTVSIGVDVGPSAPTFRYVDLGTVTIPPLAPADDFGGRAITPEGIFLGVSAARASGTGSLDLDVLLLIPADDQTLLIRWPGTASTPTDVILDATSRVGASGVPALTVYARTAGGLTRALMPARPRGGPIHISPGVTNRVWFIKDVGLDNPDNSTGDDKAATITVTPWYHPRYLHLRPATT
jgi:hypothetical protein